LLQLIYFCGTIQLENKKPILKEETKMSKEYLVETINNLDLDNPEVTGFGELYYGLDSVLRYFIYELGYSKEELVEKVLEGSLGFKGCEEIYTEAISIEELREFMGDKYAELDDEELLSEAPYTLWECGGCYYENLDGAKGDYETYYEVANFTDKWETYGILLVNY